MKFAIDRFVNNREGQELEVAAEDIYQQYHGLIPLRADSRFYCPECQEKVFFRRKGTGEFYHQARTDSTPECDKRVDGRSDLYIYERTGLPIYLSHKYGEIYSLNVAFPAIGEQQLKWAHENNVVIKINDLIDVRVTLSRFFAEETTLIPITFFPLHEKNYKIIFTSSASLYKLHKKWSDYADGFTSGGAIFNIQNNGGKKVKRGDSITIGKDYYAVTKELIPRTWQSQSLYPEINHRVAGIINLNNTNYYVYIFSVDVSADSRRFEVLNSFFYNKFKVWLVEQAATIVPIWPPIIEHGDWLSFSSKNQVYCSVESGNDSPKVFSYTGSDALPVLTKADAYHNKTVKLNVYSTIPVMFSVDRKYTGREIGIRKALLPQVMDSNSINIVVGDTILKYDASIEFATVSNGITIKSNTKFVLLQKSKKHIYKNIVIDQPTVSFDVSVDTEELVMGYGRVGAGFVPFKSVTILHPQKAISIDEDAILAQIHIYSRGDMILAPIWIKDVLHYCSKNNFQKIKRTVTSAICNGRMQKGLAIYLNQLRRAFVNG